MPTYTWPPRADHGVTARYLAGRERILGARRPLAERDPYDVAQELAEALGLMDANAFVRAVHRALMNLTREERRGA